MAWHGMALALAHVTVGVSCEPAVNYANRRCNQAVGQVRNHCIRMVGTNYQYEA